MGNTPTWQEIQGLAAVLSFAQGKTIVGEGSTPVTNIAGNRIKGVRSWDRAEVVRFNDGSALACFIRQSGPPYSDVTPDPKWDARVFYWSIVAVPMPQEPQ